MKYLKSGLNNNQLKFIAMVTMLLDHIGKEFFPEFTVLQIVGRLAFPVFAFMIAEGCFYTRDRMQYFIKIAGMAIGCQLVYFIAERSLYQNVLVTFSLSVLTIFSVEFFRQKRNLFSGILMLTDFITVAFLCFILPDILKGFHIDYGIFGILLPVAVYFAPNNIMKVAVSAVLLIGLSMDLGGIQWYSLFTVLLLAVYNGKRGKLNLKYLFYIFYPLHLAVIYLVKILFIN